MSKGSPIVDLLAHFDGKLIIGRRMCKPCNDRRNAARFHLKNDKEMTRGCPGE